MKVYVIMISPDEPPQQQMMMHAEAFEVWFDEKEADERAEELNKTINYRAGDRHYWVDEATLKIKEEITDEAPATVEHG